MATSKSKKSNQKYIIISIALALAAVGYFGYRSMLTSPDINKVAPPEKPRPTAKPTSKPPTKTPQPTTKPPQKTPVGTGYKTPGPTTKPPYATPTPKPAATKPPTYTSAPNATPRH